MISLLLGRFANLFFHFFQMRLIRRQICGWLGWNHQASSSQTLKLFITLPPLAAIFNLAFSLQPSAFSL